MRAAIRSCDGAYSCPDEDDGCPGTQWILCALDSAKTNTTANAAQVSFMGCWDEKDSEEWESKAKTCASEAKLDFTKISSCAKGTSGPQLLKDAADAFKAKFPDRPCGGIFGVPNVEINGDHQSSTDYKPLLKNLCATGIKAGACSQYAVV